MLNPHDLIYRLSTLFTRTLILNRQLRAVDGLEHLPTDRPFILIANHTSFLDHFLLEALVFAWRGHPTYFLTKQEAFATPTKRLWHESVKCIPVDRERLSRDTLRAVKRVLGDSGVVCIYPEGTRGDGQALLPFKPGAFHLAGSGSAAVPLVPVAIHGAGQILPRGKVVPTNAQASVVFGPALTRAAGEPVEVTAARARDAIQELLRRAADIQLTPPARTAPVCAERLETLLEEHFDAPDQPFPAEQGRALGQLGRQHDPRDLRLRVQALRLRGVMAAGAPTLKKLWLAWPIRLAAQDVLREHPDDPVTHYIVGRWHMVMPAALGGRARQAVWHMRQARRQAPGDTRFHLGMAEACVRTRQFTEAREHLRELLGQEARTEREQRRHHRARTVLHAFSAPTAQEVHS